MHVMGAEPDWIPWTPAEIAGHMLGLDVPWCITAGWAVDLFVGHQTRQHADVEIAIPASGWPEVRRRLSALEFFVAGGGRLWALDGPAFEAHFQTWGRDSSGVFRLDVFREPHSGQTWVYRRNSQITRQYSTLIQTTADGVPFMAPEVVLLFKAKHNRDKDRDDLAACLPLMTEAEKAWLAGAISLSHANHPWLALLG